MYDVTRSPVHVRYYRRRRGCTLTTSYTQPLCNVTARICEDSRFLFKLRSSYALDTQAAAVLAKLNNGRRVKHYSLDDGLLWFATRRGLRRLYVPASLRADVLRKSHDHELSGHGGTNNTVERISRQRKSTLFPVRIISS